MKRQEFEKLRKQTKKKRKKRQTPMPNRQDGTKEQRETEKNNVNTCKQQIR